MRWSLLMAAAMLSVSAPALAGPWIEPGDVQVREDVERLKAARIINGPTNAWPLPWAVMSDLARAADDAQLPPDLRAAAQRLQRVAELADQPNGGEATVTYTDRPALIRDFGAGAREDFDGELRVTQQLGNLYISLGGGYRRHQLGNDWHLDQTYAAYKLGNWAVYGGFVEHWWGPGNSGSLLFSTSARPFPKIGFKRLAAHPIDFPVLRWLGPWRFDMFVGDLGNRRDFDNAKVIAMRFDFAPAPGLEIGLNRALQLCGDNRPCGFNTIGKALTGFGNADNTGTPNEPGNQIAGFDLSYTTRIGPVTARLYGEMEAEDEDNIIIDKFARMAGAKFSGPLGGGGASWELGGEWTDTYAWELTTGDRKPGIVYRNFIYFDGFTYRDQPIGNSVDTDSELLSFDAAVTDTANRRYYGSFRKAKLNITARADHRLSANPENISIGTLGVMVPTQFGDLRLEGRYMNDLPGTPGRSPNAIDFEASWRTRF
ncbi:hypothetical protein BSL82_01685 [Tardibacter chloracetimidivorans]|uniref:Capsule assembly Wzi family protein n=1 Tax=Tardibacter chloracetimidivorans TaxID=1921510 RepID=A0A1L3ZRD6_9SPHN|nr:capsule assembly Wzi family protein [Tardibacter chloracetimidivorans]API58170.1 hypothetical protein BSL82_01685 [Tardibacter chloracetimidivorans]